MTLNLVSYSYTCVKEWKNKVLYVAMTYNKQLNSGGVQKNKASLDKQHHMFLFKSVHPVNIIGKIFF